MIPANVLAIREIVRVLELAKWQHYDGGYEGLTVCPALNARTDGPVCDCGAYEVNEEIEKLTAQLRKFDSISDDGLFVSWQLRDPGLTID